MHDLNRIQRDLQESLSLDKHPVALLIGAGCPLAVRVPGTGGATAPLIPDIRGLTALVTSQLSGEPAFKILLAEFTKDNVGTVNIEDMLSRVRVLSRIVGQGEARGLNSSELKELEERMCAAVAEAVRKDLPDKDTPYHKLASWVGGTRRSSPLQIFTTNYDLLMEEALEDLELPVFDGFVGVRKPFFDLRAIEDDTLPLRWPRVWKLHGSVNWCLENEHTVRRLPASSTLTSGLLIHPSELKYDQSRRMPYLAMIDRLRSFLRQPSAFLVTTGYSFADQHLNEVILQGLRSNPTAAGFALLYGKLDDEVAASTVASRIPTNLTLLARDKGVVRCNRDAWMTDPAPVSVGTAPECRLGDFSEFASFLKKLSASSGAASA